MATTAINTSGSNSEKKAMAAGAAKMAAAVGAGAVAGGIADDIINGEPEVTEEMLADGEILDETETADETEETAQETQQATHAQTQTQTDGPQPVTGETNNSSASAHSTTSNHTAASTETGTDDVDPNQIAQEIISGEQIDPNDIDAPEVLNFADVGTIYGADGHEYAAAVITDDAGNQMVVVDVDNDNEFDVVVDNEGNYVGDMPGHITVSDAELALNSDEGYIAPTDGDVSAAGIEDMIQDIITT